MSSVPSRPCDTCRVRKTRCVKADDQSTVCVLCAFHGKSCTYARGPPARRPRAARRAAQSQSSSNNANAGTTATGSPAASSGTQQQQDAARFERRGSLGSFSPEMVAKTMNLSDAPPHQHLSQLRTAQRAQRAQPAF